MSKVTLRHSKLARLLCFSYYFVSIAWCLLSSYKPENNSKKLLNIYIGSFGASCYYTVFSKTCMYMCVCLTIPYNRLQQYKHHTIFTFVTIYYLRLHFCSVHHLFRYTNILVYSETTQQELFICHLFCIEFLLFVLHLVL